MCRLGSLPDKPYIASFFLTQDGYLITIRSKGKSNKKRNFIGRPKQIKRALLWKNARAGKLGVNYKTWPWHKKAMAHFRIHVCRLIEKSFFRLQYRGNQA